MRSITRYLEHDLKLTVNLAKSKVAPMSDCSFLGFTMRGTKIRWTDKALADFKQRVKELTSRSWGSRWNTGCTSWGNTCGAEPGHKQSCGLFVPGEGSGLRPGAACKADGVLRHQPVLPPGARAE